LRERQRTDPRTPRRDAQGRDVFEVWADAVLADPAGEYARIARDILPAETPDNSNNAVVTAIGQLYLQADQAANKVPDPRVIEAIGEPEKPQDANGSNDW
jgi:hypothetical protein